MSDDDDNKVIQALFPSTGELRRDSIDRLLESRSGTFAQAEGSRTTHEWRVCPTLAEVIVRTPGATLVVWDVDDPGHVPSFAQALRASARGPLLLARVDPQRRWAADIARLLQDMMAEQGMTLSQQIFVKGGSGQEQGFLYSYRRQVELPPLELLQASGPISSLEMLLRHALEVTCSMDTDPMVLSHGAMVPLLPMIARLHGVSSRTQCTTHGEVQALERALHGLEGERR